MKNKFDSIIIGFGKAGKTLAAHLAAKGEQIALIEKSDKMYGGTCINAGCIPSKSLVRSAAISAAHPEEPFEKKSQRYTEAIQEKRRVTTMLRSKNYSKLNDLPNVTVINATARFTGPQSVEAVTSDSVFTLSADKIFINTGAAPVIPNIKGIDSNRCIYYSDSLMELDTLPEKLIIVGGGYIGLEFASMYSAFGSDVTVLQDGPVFIPREDPDVAAAIKALLEAQGVKFRLGATIKELAHDGTAHYEWQGNTCQDKADAILLATGRRPNVSGLYPEAAGVDLTERSAVAVDELLRTTQPGIWAMGDVTGGLQFTYVSLDDYRIIAAQLEGGDYTAANRKNIPYSVFMATPFSRVGLNEAEAKKAGFNVKLSVMPAAAVPKAQVLNKTGGMLKAIIDADTKQILGAALLCEESYEMINIIKLAMDLNAPYTVLRDQIFTHPTMSESLNDLFNI